MTSEFIAAVLPHSRASNDIVGTEEVRGECMNFMVVIECPTTHREVPTGVVVDIATFETMPGGAAELVCPECKQTHVWSTPDAMLTSIPHNAGLPGPQ